MHSVHIENIWALVIFACSKTTSSDEGPEPFIVLLLCFADNQCSLVSLLVPRVPASEIQILQGHKWFD